MNLFYQHASGGPELVPYLFALRFFKKLLSVNLVRFAFLAVALLFSDVARGDSADPHPDYAPLADLYNSTNGPGWTNSSNWLTTDNPCGWYGVSCTENRVTTLNLSSNKLDGVLPESFGNLKNLQFLYLFNNKISGSLPGSLGYLNDLVSLSLGNNSLTGEVPASFGNLKKLVGLSIGQNKLSGAIPAELGNMSNLQDLYLADNKLTGSIPSSLGNLAKLEGLNLAMNQLSGAVPGSLGQLSHLRVFALSDNSLEGSIPGSLGDLLNVWYFTLNNNKLTGEIPATLGSLTNLTYLTLDVNQLSGTIPASFGNLRQLVHLNFNSNQLTGNIPDSFKNLTSLQQLYVGSNRLSGSIPTFLGSLTNLQGLNLNDNQFSGAIPASLGSLAKLKYLNLNMNQLSGVIPSSLGNLADLITVAFNHNQLSGPIPASFGNLSKLTNMYGHSNQFSGCFPEALKALCGQTIDFSNNPGLPGGGNFSAFCNNEPGSNAMSAPTLALTASVSQPVLQNTPSVSITVAGCEGGTVTWAGPNNAKGTGATIPVATAAVGTFAYSATCTVGSCVSPVGTTSVVVSAAPTTGNFDGFVYGVDCETFRGWAWNRDKVNTVISVDILEGATVIATIPAGDFRQDLLNAGKGNGKHAFTFPIPAHLKDGQPHLFTARVAGSNFMLKNPPKALTCQGSGGPANQPPVAPTTVPLSVVINQAVGALLPAFTDPENGALTYALTGLPAGLNFNPANRTITGIPTVGGEFLITYSATDDQQAKTQVVFFLTVTVPQPVNQPPVAPTTTPLSATIGAVFITVLPAFTDPESQPLTYALSSLPTGLSFTTGNRTLSGTAASGTAGSYVLTYSASDGTNTTPVNLTLTVSQATTTPPTSVTGSFEGYLSVVNCQEMRGWVWDRNKPNTPMMVEFFADGVSIGTVEAKNYRQDLKDAQKGNGYHGYIFATPSSIQDNVNRQISAKVQNSSYVLKGSPTALRCASSGRLSAENSSQLQVLLLGNPVFREVVELEIRGAEGQPLRLELTDASGRLITERQIAQAGAVERQTLTVSQQPAGLLFLRTTSGSQQVILKVIKP